MYLSANPGKFLPEQPMAASGLCQCLFAIGYNVSKATKRLVNLENKWGPKVVQEELEPSVKSSRAIFGWASTQRIAFMVTS